MPSVSELLSAGRLQEAEWHIRRGDRSPLSLDGLAQRLGTRLNPQLFFVSPGYYAPFSDWHEAQSLCAQAYESDSVIQRYRDVASTSISHNPSSLPISPYTIRQLAALQHAWLSTGRPNTIGSLCRPCRF